MRHSIFLSFALVVGCSSSNTTGSNANNGSNGSATNGSNGTATNGSNGGDGGSSNGATNGATNGSTNGSTTGGGGTACGSLTCDYVCSSGGMTTTISGTVYDPAGNNPLYGISVYVPANPLTPLPKGVPVGNDACSCAALYPSGAIVSTVTAIDGTFTLTNAPVGTNVPLVIQIGKWRKQFLINVDPCMDNPQMDKTLALPGMVAAGDTDTNMPDIAVSTGSADTLECLMLRMGIASSEYVAGTSTAGHIHLFSGGQAGGTTGGGGTGPGRPERNVMTGSPASSTDLWKTQDQLMSYDITLLSCEGGETYNANPAALEAYLNAGGRAFGSHFHYSWFSGPIQTTQGYTAPTDWGTNLATWTGGGGMDNGPIGGVIETTLNGSTNPFPKGGLLQQWLMARNALAGDPTNMIPAGQLEIYQPRYNAVVAAANTPSQAWITAGAKAATANSTLYFSFDTPIGGVGGMANQYCGRAVFSDLHVSGNPMTNDLGNTRTGGKAPPAGCGTGKLSPQELALEFMLFDLSSCVLPDSTPPPADGGIPIT
jgi:hypothetical protein